MSSGGGGNFAGIWSLLTHDIWNVGHWWGEWGVSRGFLLSIVFAGEYLVLSNLIPSLTLFTLSWLLATAPIWLPIGLVVGAWKAWIWYVQSLYLSGRHPILLEMTFPREITRSPRAMEIAFGSFSMSSGETTVFHRAWKGQVRPFFSFEIASFGGDVHFYVWCWKNYQDTVETAIYGAYPEVELHEVEDYAIKFQYDPKKHRAWGVEWPLQSQIVKMDDFRINAYQPRSYVDFELDKDPKEEFKIDPLFSVIEFMSSIKPNEQLWIQFVIRKAGKQLVLNPWGEKDDDEKWRVMIEKEVQRLRAVAAIVPTDALHQAYEDAGEDLATSKQPPMPRPSWRHQKIMEAMERHLGKYPFEVGARGIYWAEGALRGPIYTGFRWIWRPFGNPQYGTHLRPRRWHCDFDWPWQDFHGVRWINQTRRVLDAYRRRMFFHSPWIIPTNIFTNETLASLWHPPSRAISAPGLSRMPSTKSAPPANLPM